MAGIFKAYDVRGIYPEEINEEIAYKIGCGFANLIQKGPIVVGRDMRTSSLPIFQEFTRAITDEGLDVIDIGLVTTPMTTFCNGQYQYSGSAMITASHNSKEYNGLKISRKNAIPIGYETGLAEIEKYVHNFKDDHKKAEHKGKIYTKAIMSDYVEHLLKGALNIKPLKIVVDAGNGMGSHISKHLFKKLSCELIPLYFELDGTFPNHDANPLKKENLVDLIKAVKLEKADLGAAFDGDADRIMFVDNHGESISADLTTALIAQQMLADHPGERVLYDLRSSRVVKEVIEKAGGTSSMSKVGHSFIKKQLREEDGIFAGELSGHYYFRDHFYADSAAMALIYMLSLISQKEQKLSDLISPLRRYFSSGEINSKVKDAQEIMGKVENHYKDAKIHHLDGTSIEYFDWWCNIRPSNTEPLLRLNLEANSQELLNQKTEEILNLIRSD